MSTSRESLAAVRTLLAEVVHSFEKLEILVHLHRAPVRAHAAIDIARALGLPVDDVSEALAGLLPAKLIKAASDDRARWMLDVDGPRAATVGALVKLYDEDRMAVLKLMTDLALDRVRAHTAQRFADAFVIRLKKKGEPDA